MTRIPFSVLIAAALTIPATSARAEDMHHGHMDHGAHAEHQAPAAPGAGQMQHTAMRGYRLARYDSVAKLYLFTHGMQPLGVRVKDAQAQRGEGLDASGTAVITKADGATVSAPLTPAADGTDGVGYLSLALPADIGEPASIRCEVHVTGAKPDVVTFAHPPILPTDTHTHSHTGHR